MNWLDDIFRRPLDELVVPDVQLLLPERTVREWQIDEAGRQALTSFGLPLIEDAGFFPTEDPEPGPRRIDDDDGYELGSISHLNIFVLRGSGRVVAVPEEPGIGNSGLVNSSVTNYVESSWRFYWLHRGLGDSVTDETYEAMAEFLDRLRVIDPTIGDDPNSSLWPSVLAD
ncbi:MAG: hypothetical protein QOC80_577 [Frankiaceae bacterium]|jgi:hypothetical protein|nr:hypothetical protein [Frankiaceae bacterium]